MKLSKLVLIIALTSYNVSHGYDGSFQMSSDYDLKQQALDQLINSEGDQSLTDEMIKSLGLSTRPPAAIERDFYDLVPSPMETDVTGKAQGPKYEDVAPFSAMYAKEFAPGDKAYREAMNGDMWKHVNADQGPGNKHYKSNDPAEKLRMFGSTLQDYMNKNGLEEEEE